eukprot:6214412-Pyramimonas_sp.AAC.1
MEKRLARALSGLLDGAPEFRELRAPESTRRVLLGRCGRRPTTPQAAQWGLSADQGPLPAPPAM